MNLILENTDRVPRFTDMRWVLETLGISAADDDGYVGDLEMNHASAGFATALGWRYR
ncbi:MAG: hypothetical protein KA752_11560 [Giesbergeria sp.]|nr:hypothetical protein [Giesbergeria sp.]